MNKMERELEGIWKFSAHEIVKYNPLYFDLEGHYTKEEWTSRNDINKVYNGKLFTFEEYMKNEQKYVDAVKELMRITGSSYLSIFYMDSYYKSTGKYMLSKKNPFRDNDKPLFNTFIQLKQGKRFHLNNIDDIIYLNLREYVYTVLVNWKHNLEIRFGYDYYMTCNCNVNQAILSERMQDIGLYLDPRQ
ncbi:hypothetical protein [Bacteroides sp.]